MKSQQVPYCTLVSGHANPYILKCGWPAESSQLLVKSTFLMLVKAHLLQSFIIHGSLFLLAPVHPCSMLPIYPVPSEECKSNYPKCNSLSLRDFKVMQTSM
ncbi:hypothetical protein MRX96_038361 [Rhipicephalus microplus]